MCPYTERGRCTGWLQLPWLPEFLQRDNHPLKGAERGHRNEQFTTVLVWTQDVRDLKGTIVNISRVQEGGIRGVIGWSSQVWEVLLSSHFFLLSLPVCSLIFLFKYFP